MVLFSTSSRSAPFRLPLPRRGLLYLLFALGTLGNAAGYGYEVVLGGEGVEFGVVCPLPTDPREGAFVRGTYRAGLGYPVTVGKVSIAGQLAAGIGLSAVGSAGWGGEWFLADWFSWEAALLVTGGLCEPWIGVTLSPQFYSGTETLFRANLLFLDGDLALGLAGGPSVRWLQGKGAQVAFSAFPLLALRFD